MDIAYQGQILLEIRRRFGAGMTLVASENAVLNEFRDEVCSDEPDLRKLSKIAARDAGLIARLTEIANASLRFKAKKPINALQAVNRLGISGCKGVIFSYIIVQSTLNLSPSWRRLASAINTSTLEVTARIYELSEDASNRQTSALAFNIAVMFALSCFAKIIASSHLKMPCNKELISFAKKPEILLVEILAQQLGYGQPFLNLIHKGKVEDTPHEPFNIAMEAWRLTFGEEPEKLNVHTLKFKH